MAKQAKTRQPVRGPEDYIDSLSKMHTKLNSPDSKDYRRTIAGRGDTHALDGGRIPASKTKRGKAFKKAMADMPRQPLIPVWEDRDVSKRGSKLGG